MESSRDSSVWRSLAVTFGGGLALGAVGMRLTQAAIKPAEFSTRPEIQPLPPTVDDRLDRMERRLERIEQTPATTHSPVTAQIDHKVLEAVVGAVEARIHEHAGQVERRIADMEARFTVELQLLHQQNLRISEGTEKNFVEIQKQFRQEAMSLRTALTQDFRQLAESASKTAAEQASIQAELQTLHQQDDLLRDSAAQGFADIRHEYRVELAARLDSLENSMETRIVTAAAAAAAGHLEEQLAPLRAEVQQKEQELAVLRQRLAESERTVLDMVVSIGQVCRQAAGRMGGPRETPASATLSQDSSPASAPIAPAAAEPARPEISAVSLPAPHQPTVSATPAEAPPPVSLAQALPDFLSESNGSRSWRIPLVSSFLVLTTGCLALIHYL